MPRSKLPSSAEEGKADAVAAAGVVLANKIILLISTTPSARAEVASQLFLSRAATPPRLRRGVRSSRRFAATFHCGRATGGYITPEYIEVLMKRIATIAVVFGLSCIPTHSQERKFVPQPGQVVAI